jgi:hypothetical protein
MMILPLPPSSLAFFETANSRFFTCPQFMPIEFPFTQLVKSFKGKLKDLFLIDHDIVCHFLPFF